MSTRNRSSERGSTSEPGTLHKPDRHAPSRDEVERRAYELYLLRGDGVAGNPETDWRQAEQELTESAEPTAQPTG
jgi:hypothetical protein